MRRKNAGSTEKQGACRASSALCRPRDNCVVCEMTSGSSSRLPHMRRKLLITCTGFNQTRMRSPHRRPQFEVVRHCVAHRLQTLAAMMSNVGMRNDGVTPIWAPCLGAQEPASVRQEFFDSMIVSLHLLPLAVHPRPARSQSQRSCSGRHPLRASCILPVRHPKP